MLWRDAIWTWNFAWKIRKRSLVRPTYKWEDNIKMDLKYVLDPSHWQQGQALCSCEHSNGPYCSVVTHSAIQCNITTKGVRKVTPPVCIFTPRQGIEMKGKTKYSSVFVLWLCSSLFHVAPPRLTQRRQRWTSFASLSLFDCPGCTLYYFIACDTNSSSCKQPEVRRGQIWAVARVSNNFKCYVLYRRCCGSTTAGSDVIMLEKLRRFSLKNASYSFFNFFRVFSRVPKSIIVPLTTYCWWIMALWSQQTVSRCFPAEERVLDCFLSGKRGVTIFKRLAFHFRVVVTHPTPVPRDNAVQKIITLTFVARE